VSFHCSLQHETFIRRRIIVLEFKTTMTPEAYTVKFIALFPDQSQLNCRISSPAKQLLYPLDTHVSTS
jgi:hypothetical protein